MQSQITTYIRLLNNIGLRMQGAISLSSLVDSPSNEANQQTESDAYACQNNWINDIIIILIQN